jgi:hypothetical protein
VRSVLVDHKIWILEMVRYPSDEHGEGQDRNLNDDAVGNRYADMIAVGVGQT